MDRHYHSLACLYLKQQEENDFNRFNLVYMDNKYIIDKWDYEIEQPSREDLEVLFNEKRDVLKKIIRQKFNQEVKKQLWYKPLSELIKKTGLDDKPLHYMAELEGIGIF